LVEEFDRLQKEFDDFRSTSTHDLEKHEESSIALMDKSTKLERLEKRILELEKMFAAFNSESEKTFAVFNKNWNDYREIIDKKIENLKGDESIENIRDNIQQEFSSLRQIVQALSNENQELRRGLEQADSSRLLGDISTKMSSFENKLSEVDKKLKKHFWSRPVILE